MNLAGGTNRTIGASNSGAPNELRKKHRFMGDDGWTTDWDPCYHSHAIRGIFVLHR